MKPNEYIDLGSEHAVVKLNTETGSLEISYDAYSTDSSFQESIQGFKYCPYTGKKLSDIFKKRKLMQEMFEKEQKIKELIREEQRNYRLYNYTYRALLDNQKRVVVFTDKLDVFVQGNPQYSYRAALGVSSNSKRRVYTVSNDIFISLLNKTTSERDKYLIEVMRLII